MANRIIKLVPSNSASSFQEAFGQYSNAGGRGKRKFNAVLSGGVSEVALRAKEAKEAKEAKAREMAQRKANEALAAGLTQQHRRNVARYNKRMADEAAAASANQQAPYDQSGQMLNGQQYDQFGNPVMPLGGEFMPQYNPQAAQYNYPPQQQYYQQPPAPMYAPQGGNPYVSTEDWNSDPSNYQGWGNQEDSQEESQGYSEEDEGSYQEDGAYDEGLDGEFVNGVDGAFQSNIDPRLMDIVSKAEWKKEKLKSLSDKISRGDKMYQDADNYDDAHNRRVMIASKLSPLKKMHKSITDEVSALEGNINSYSSASGVNAVQVKKAKDIAASDIQKQKILAKSQATKLKDSGSDMQVDIEMNPLNKKNKPVMKTSNASGTGIIAKDDQNDADAIPPRVFDIQYSNADGSNTKRIAIGLGVGIVIAGGLLWALKHYKVI